MSPRAFASPASPASQWLTTAPDVLDGRASDDASERKQAATRELLQRLAPGLSRSSEGLSWRDRGQGVRSLDLHGRFRHTMIAVRGEDGAVRTTCVDDLPSAQRVLEAADRSAP